MFYHDILCLKQRERKMTSWNMNLPSQHMESVHFTSLHYLFQIPSIEQRSKTDYKLLTLKQIDLRAF
jgi:hypothetical protein